jgi:DNA-binding helix-hairpin-helix protein with protein kinase domain
MIISKDCGNAVELKDCPWCGEKIGAAVYNNIVQRAGHKRMTDDNAKQYLIEKMQKYEQNQPMGYFNVALPNKEIQMSFYQQRPISWRLLMQFIHVPMYFFLT